jgi:lysophospholipase L1-like esterase
MGRRSRVGHNSLAAPVAIPLLLLGLLGQLVFAAGSGAATKVKVSAGAHYVAMGSSYGAGFFIQPQEPGNPGGCGRSEIDYPHLVAAKLHLQLDDVTCGGATTANALTTPQGANPPQIDAVTAQTRLVTMTIGGNDVNYVATAIECGSQNATCATAANTAQIDAAFRALPDSLTQLIQAIRAKAPKAAIVLVTYVRLVPPTPCAALAYTPAATRLVGSIGQRLEHVFVSVAKADHIRLVDPYAIGAKHGPCASGSQKWIAGLTPTNGFEYHPTAAGHRQMAHMVEQELAAT